MNRKPAGTHYRRLNVCLPPAVAEWLRELGGGNLSAGIRKAHEYCERAYNLIAVLTPEERAGLATHVKALREAS